MTLTAVRPEIDESPCLPGCGGHLGKFDDCRSEAVWEMSLEFPDDQTGSCDFQGHYALVLVGEDWLHQMEGEVAYVPVPAGAYVVFTATAGWVSVTRYDSEEEARNREFDEAEKAYSYWACENEI